jgi:hypothetical protein
MILRLEFALRAAAVRPHQPVVGVVAVVLFVQIVAPADQVAPAARPVYPDWVRGVAAGGL